MRLVAMVIALAAASPARAHEIVHEVRPGAVAVKVSYAGGEPLAYAEAEVFSPADPRVAFQKGRTDRNGVVAFAPDVPGAWRVRVVEAGHGLDATIQVAPGAIAAAPAGGAGGAARTLAGAALVVGIFAALYAWQRSRRRSAA